MTIAVAGLIALAVLRARPVEADESSDMRVYRDQLREVDRDLARGVLTPDEAERVRLEVSRRLLEADRQGASAARLVEGRGTRILAAGALGFTVVASFGLYAWLGAPGYPDLPIEARLAAADEMRAVRPSQETAEANLPPGALQPVEPPGEFATLMERLREAVAARPDDLQGQQLLAQNEARLGNYRAAYEAQRRVISLRPGGGTAEDYAGLADTMILAAGGYVSPEAEAALTEALLRDPTNGSARYYRGLMFAQTGRPDRAFEIWRALLEEGPADAPWTAPIRAQIEAVAADAGIRFALPPASRDGAPPGPDADALAAASDMTPEERAAMIEGMVAGLADRLATEGGPPEDWARLIGAYGVLGEADRAAAIWAEAQTVFADAPAALDTIRAAAERAGIAE